MDEISALRIAQRISPSKYSEREYKLSEDRIHERDHERRMARALLSWQEEKEKESQLNITDDSWDSPDETLMTSTFVTAPLANTDADMKRG